MSFNVFLLVHFPIILIRWLLCVLLCSFVDSPGLLLCLPDDMSAISLPSIQACPGNKVMLGGRYAILLIWPATCDTLAWYSVFFFSALSLSLIILWLEMLLGLLSNWWLEWLLQCSSSCLMLWRWPRPDWPGSSIPTDHESSSASLSARDRSLCLYYRVPLLGVFTYLILS